MLDSEANLLLYLNKNYQENSDIFNLDEKSIKINGPILENVNDGILNLDTEKLLNEYYSKSFPENCLKKYENLFNDFKITLKMIESLKNEYKIEPNQSRNTINSNL